MSNEEIEQAIADSPPVLVYRVGQLEKAMSEFRAEMKEEMDKLGKVFGSFNKWLIGVMGTLILALVMLVINLATRANASGVSISPH